MQVTMDEDEVRDEVEVKNSINAWRQSERKIMIETVQDLIQTSHKYAKSQYTPNAQRVRWTKLAGQLIWYKDQILKNFSLEAMTETESSRSQIGVRKVNLSYSPNRIVVRGLMVRVARRYQVTIPEEVREKAKISVGDDVDVRYEDGKILLEKLEDNWEKVMKETEGSWADHPVFGKMKNSVEIVHWLRSER